MVLTAPPASQTPRFEPTDRARALIELNAERLEAGYTPNAAWYRDPDLFEYERHEIFGRVWQLVGMTTDLESPGSYISVPIDDCREFVVVRGDDGVLRGFHNVCQHRANMVVEGNGRSHLLQCNYHGWTYRLDGGLHRAPAMETAPSFDPSDYGLRQVSVDTFGPFVFLNPDPGASPLAEHLGDVPERVRALGIDMESVARQGNAKVVDFVLECNWKVAVENSLECYHCPSSHPGLGATFDMKRWQIAVLSEHCIVQGTSLRPADAPAQGRAAATRMGPVATAAAFADDGMNLAMFHWLFPNNSISVWPGPGNSFNIARWMPIGPERTRWWSVRWWPADVDPVARDEQWDFMLQIGIEDQRIVENLQRGLRSGAWDGGRFQLQQEHTGEHGPRQFNRLVAAALRD
jgi:choline monooxygenase